MLINKSLNKTRAHGERRIYMKEGTSFDLFLTAMGSGLEVSIALDVMRAVGHNGYLKLNQVEFAEKRETTRVTVSKVFKKGLDSGALMPVGRRWYLNPYMVLPYNLKDEYCNKLQQQWDQLVRLYGAKGKVTLNEALLIHEDIFGPELTIDMVTGEF